MTARSVCIPKTHIEVFNGLSDVEPVYGADNDGGSREKGEQEHEEEVDQHIAQEPLITLHGEVVPVGWGNRQKQRQ